MKLTKKEVIKNLRGFLTKANALIELRKNGADFLDYYEALQLRLEYFIKSNNVSGFDLGIERSKKGEIKFRHIEDLAPDLESFVKKLEREQL